MKQLPFWKQPYFARRILDVGAGHNPFRGATHLLEIDVKEGRERGMQDVFIPDFSVLTIGDVSALPYRSSSFDFVYASHVLEHVDNPVAACREIMRVGAAGYVETPSPFLEQGLAMYDSQSPAQWIHKWFVFVGGTNRLIFEPKTADEVFRFCTCRAGEFMKDFYSSIDFREAQHCFPGRAKRTTLYWKRALIPEVRNEMRDCRESGQECRFSGMANELTRSCSDLFRAPRLLRLRRQFPVCNRVFRRHGYRSLFIH